MAGFAQAPQLDRAIASHHRFHAAFWGHDAFEGLSQASDQRNRFTIAGQQVDAPFPARLDGPMRDAALMLSDDPLQEIGMRAQPGDNMIPVDQCDTFVAKGIAPLFSGLDGLVYVGAMPQPLALATLAFRESMFTVVEHGHETVARSGTEGRVVAGRRA